MYIYEFLDDERREGFYDIFCFIRQTHAYEMRHTAANTHNNYSHETTVIYVYFFRVERGLETKI